MSRFSNILKKSKFTDFQGRLRLRCTVGILIALVTSLAVTGALASGATFEPVPGATYTGSVGRGTISITVSSDGTLVTGYSFVGVTGTNSVGGGCTIGGAGSTPAWAGAPISNGSWEYLSPSSMDLVGTFDGTQSAAGTIDITIDASPPSEGCSTGVIDWSATTTSAPPSTGTAEDPVPPVTSTPPSTEPPGNGGAQSVSGDVTKAPLSVRISLRRRSKAKLTGSLRSTSRVCIARRTVTLWQGHRRAGTSRTTADGAFTFKTSLHDRAVRATVSATSLSQLTCAAASSTFIRA